MICHFKMDNVSIVPYEQEYHETAKYLFKYGMYEHLPNALRMNLTSRRNLGVSFSTFTIGLILDSWQMGIVALLLTITLQSLSIVWSFYNYVK